MLARPTRNRSKATMVGLTLAGFTAVSVIANHPALAADAHSHVVVKQSSVGASAVSVGGTASASKPYVLGMTYVVPPHVAGAKVRTPEGLGPVLAERLARSLPLKQVTLGSAGGGLNAPGEEPAVDAMLVPIEPVAEHAENAAVIPTGYRAGIMAIMRSDTDIKRWEDLRGRIVCIAEGSGLAGTLQSRYGATEKIFRAPADALLDLRIGGCDAAVHDSTMLEALLRFPEWKKFSARLPILHERELAIVLRSSDEALRAALQSQAREWRETDLLAKLTNQSARDIAFEVYLDQEVPDCH